MPRAVRVLIVAWSAGGVALLLLNPLFRLLPRALEPLAALTPFEAAAYAAIVLFLGYTEGYKAFHKAFVPRVVARALALSRAPRALPVLLGPLHAMALFDARPRRLATSWAVTLMVVALIVAVQRMPMPWRGMVDGGVVLSLGWGAVRLFQLLAAAALGRLPTADPEFAARPAAPLPAVAPRPDVP